MYRHAAKVEVTARSRHGTLDDTLDRHHAPRAHCLAFGQPVARTCLPGAASLLSLDGRPTQCSHRVRRMSPVSESLPGLDLDAPPFDLLDAGSRQRLLAAVDLGYFPIDTVLIEQGRASEHFFVVLKGRVLAFERREGEEHRFADFGPGEVFGAFAVIIGRARHGYRALEDTLCFQIPAAVFKRLLTDNPRFAAWFHEGLAVKQQLADNPQPSELGRLMLTRVGDAQLAPAVTVPDTTGIADACDRMRSQRVDCLMVAADADQHELGIVTRTDLLDALALHRRPCDSPIADLASRPLITVRAQDALFQALVTMTERHIERVAVRDGERIIGTLGMAEVLAHYASTSHLISLRLARARTLAEIADAAQGLTELVRTLNAQGARVSYLMEMVSALNGRIMRRIFESIVPERHRDHLCLLVLGSEGRREQILKTDQDNALIIADSLDWPDHDQGGLDAAMARFSAALAEVGYPPCPGAVMVSNRHWRMTVGGWLERIERWHRNPDGQAMLDLSIVLDARFIAGRESLFQPLAEALLALGRDDILIRQLAEPAVRFGPALTLFGQVKGDRDGTDIKKGGLFPLVHGLRVLALKHGIGRRNSFDRCQALVEAGVLPESLGHDLAQAMAVLQRLRLNRQLDALTHGEPPDNRIVAATLGTLDREWLRDALRVVKSFNGFLAEALHLKL